MAGCLDTLVITVPKMPLSMDSIREYLGERKNLVVSVAAGVLVRHSGFDIYAYFSADFASKAQKVDFLLNV